MEEYKKRFAEILASTGALFFEPNLRLKDGRPTPYFVNLGKFRSGRLNYEIGSLFADMLETTGLINTVDVVLGPSYKGSALANATVNALWLKYGRDVLFEYDRKEAKTHGESSGGSNLFVNGCLDRDRVIFIVDDVGTSMATKYELLEKVARHGQEKCISIAVKGIGLAVDREQSSAVYDDVGKVIPDVKGKDAIGEFRKTTGVPVRSLCGIRETIGHLRAERIPVLINGTFQPLDDKTLSAFETYLDTYGVQRDD